jgi:hypothetical protein
MGKNSSPEHDLQVGLVELIRDTAPDLLFSATNGGVRLSMNQARRMKAAGYLKGIPDLLFFEPRHGFHGLALELKAKRGKISAIQREQIEEFRIRGWRAEIAFGWDQAIHFLRDYFEELEDASRI